MTQKGKKSTAVFTLSLKNAHNSTENKMRTADSQIIYYDRVAKRIRPVYRIYYSLHSVTLKADENFKKKLECRAAGCMGGGVRINCIRSIGPENNNINNDRTETWLQLLDDKPLKRVRCGLLVGNDHLVKLTARVS